MICPEMFVVCAGSSGMQKRVSKSDNTGFGKGNIATERLIDPWRKKERFAPDLRYEVVLEFTIAHFFLIWGKWK